MPRPLPAFLNPRRIEGRIVALFLALLLLVQLASLAFTRQTIEANAERAIDAKLATAGRMMQRLLVQQAAREQAAAELLAADWGFREALGRGYGEQEDRDTIRDALANNGERVGAALVAYTDLDGRLVAATRPGIEALLKSLREGADPELPAMVLLDGQLLQLATVPVKAPTLMGHVLMGFALDDTPLQDLKRLVNIDAMFLTAPRDQPWVELVSLLEPREREQMGSVLNHQEPGLTVMRSWGDQRWELRLMSLPLRDLASGPPSRAAVAMWASVDEEMAPYRQLQLSLLALTLAGLLAFAVGSIFTARRISRPIASLAESAERLGRGDYETPVTASSTLGEVSELASAFELMRHDIRDREAQVHRLAFWDPLTGLPNREQFSQRLSARLAEGGEHPCAVLMLDLDRFKHVNDVLGHAFGDRLLRSVAVRLQALQNTEGSLLARLGGDEFALLLEGADEAAALAQAARIHQDFVTPLCIDDQTVDLGAGIGIALAPSQGRDTRILLARAELAMYAAKRRQSGSMVYESALDAGSQEALSLLSELRRAIERQELRLFLQPKVDFKTGQVHSAEALVRWEHPERGLVPPMQFIPFAEQTGFIRQLTAWVIEESARFAQQARARGLSLRISVNLSTRDLLDQELPAKIAALLGRHGTDPSMQCLEITESAIMDDPQRALQTLERLSEMGFKLSIDDFGTGYSSLAYLKRLPVNELKIDRSFVMAMERDLDDAKIVRSTIELAHNLGLSVVAEGVETGKAWKLLAALGCDEGQGYFIGRPVPAAQLLDWLPRWKAPDLGDESLDTVFAGLN
ncbi:EAL domain-containing protein [Kinneretia asaccharophila]|uniref:Diguanylate cyclase/phosphodiesterase n=1 Tax=Roseateles asaccharophilus TaxID=582607 RepID=A0A4R6NFR2_9BURK|nr:EAL domain-containing protein [Roseateles asaccharophilus]MDN3543197.1 EAL domain-containing protein [Roseateles asaccharophilus]TDP13104.1 diguanylate cyclase/phosphodiesterase [Roseateles asaccharophilus]